MACMASSAASHYEVLGLDAQSSDDDIKTAFRQAAKRLHPDVNKEPGAEKRFIRINEAYATLSDPQRRRQYDAQLRATAASRAATGRAGTRSATSSGWVEYAWVVDFDDDSDDEDDEDVMEFFRWSTSGQNMRSSYQSSWQANAKKRQARQAATQAQQGGAQRQQGSQQRTAGQRRQEVTEADRAEILGSLRTDARQYAQKIFGRRLENLETWKQLDEFVDALEAMHLQEMDLHSFDSDDELFDSDDDEEDGWVRSPPRRGTNGASSSSQQAAPGARKSKTWQGDVDWETFVADFDTGSASSSKARQRQASSPFSASSRGAAAAAGAAAGSRGSAPGRGARQPAMPKMKSPPKRKSVVDDDDDDDDLNMDELEQLLSILVDTEDVGTGRKRAASRRPRGRRQ